MIAACWVHEERQINRDLFRFAPLTRAAEEADPTSHAEAPFAMAYHTPQRGGRVEDFWPVWCPVRCASKHRRSAKLCLNCGVRKCAVRVSNPGPADQENAGQLTPDLRHRSADDMDLVPTCGYRGPPVTCGDFRRVSVICNRPQRGGSVEASEGLPARRSCSLRARLALAARPFDRLVVCRRQPACFGAGRSRRS
jgi:hypothetical protein